MQRLNISHPYLCLFLAQRHTFPKIVLAHLLNFSVIFTPSQPYCLIFVLIISIYGTPGFFSKMMGICNCNQKGLLKRCCCLSCTPTNNHSESFVCYVRSRSIKEHHHNNLHDLSRKGLTHFLKHGIVVVHLSCPQTLE